MKRLTRRTSTIIISADDGIRVFHSLEDIPMPLRQKLVESTGGANAATILIADEQGRREIVRSLTGLPTEFRSRLVSALARAGRTRDSAGGLSLRWRHGIGLCLLIGLGVLLWLLLT